MEFDEVFKSSVTHLGNGKGVARLLMKKGGGGNFDLYEFRIPYHFPITPDGPTLKIKWDEFEFECDDDLELDEVPEQVREEVNDLRQEMNEAANY